MCSNLCKLTVTPLLIVAVLVSGGCGGSNPTAPIAPNVPTINFDCTSGPDCPMLTMSGDPLYVLPNGADSPFRGFADPSLRKDPGNSRLWLSYSYVGVHPDLVTGNVVITPSVEIHLAHSDDNGNSWSYDKAIWASTIGTDQGATTDVGYSIHEVSTIAPFTFNSMTEWFGLHLRYFLKQGDPIEMRKGDSFHHRLTRGTTPTDLGNNPEAILTNPLTATGWGSDLDLTALSPELSICTLFAEPALHQVGNHLYLITECLVVDTSVNPPLRVPADEFNAVFATEVGNDVTAFNWQYIGKITDNSLASELGASILTQVDMAHARDGKLILIITPTDSTGDGNVAHQGCRVLEIASLNPPRLARNPDNSLIVRADIRSSDSESSGLCAYDPDSDTGVILTRTHIDLNVPEVEWSLHATGIHP